MQIPHYAQVYLQRGVDNNLDCSIDNIHVISSTVKAGDTGIVISVSGAYANMTMNWKYSYSNWWLLVPISDNGKASIQVKCRNLM